MIGAWVGMASAGLWYDGDLGEPWHIGNLGGPWDDERLGGGGGGAQLKVMCTPVFSELPQSLAG